MKRELPDDWQPLDRRDAPEAVADGPHDSIPSWLVNSLDSWTKSRLTYAGGRHRNVIEMHWDVLREAERRLKAEFPPTSYLRADKVVPDVLRTLRGRPRLYLGMLDFLVAKEGGAAATALNKILLEGASLYRVNISGNPPGLERRVDPTTSDLADQEMEQDTDAAVLLTKAWRRVFGLDPDASDGYRAAVRAVEAAAIPVVLPNDRDATLSRVIGELRGNPGRFATSFRQQPGKLAPLDAVRDMCALLWTTQYDRHVTDGAPLEMSQEQAEAALPVAVSLVHLFRTGAVTVAE